MMTISSARRDAVLRGLRQTFGLAEMPAMQEIRGGVSGALVLRFEVHDHHYVLRVEPTRVAVSDRLRNYAAMGAAATSGAAPAVRYADAASGVAIIDFIQSRPLDEYPGGTPGLIRALGTLVGRVQASAPFPAVGLFPDVIAAALRGLASCAFVSLAEIDRYAGELARIRAALPWDESALVSAHNDPNPRNILSDGERLWLVDWELAFRNDPLADIAILTTEFAETPELEEALLAAVFGGKPTTQLQARLGVVRLLTRLFYGCIVLDSLKGMPPPEVGDSVRSPSAFRQAVTAGRLKSGSREVAFAFAMMSLNAFMDGVSQPAFGTMLKRAQQG